jgi:predicted amidohydrolase YtcJ
MTTINAASIEFEERKKGVPEDQIMNIKSYMTIVDGKVVHEAQPAR